MNPKHTAYPLYGARGIRVCIAWDSYEQFLADMGRRPAGSSIERIDNSGNYEPGNCRWATRLEQNSNRRDTRWVTHPESGERKTLSQWSRALHVSTGMFGHHLRKYGERAAFDAAIKTKMGE